MSVSRGAYIGGNLGIGTTNPAAKLDVAGEARMANDALRLWQWNNANSDIDGLLPGSAFGSIIQGDESGHSVFALRENDGGDGFAFITGGGNYTADGTYDTMAMFIKANGDVGLGTTSPGAKLDILRVGSGTQLKLSDSATNATFKAFDGGAGNDAVLDIDTHPSGTGNDAIVRFFRNTNTSGPVAIHVLKGNNTTTSNARIAGSGNTYFAADNGNVGIGTTTPSEKLEVNGNVKATAFYYSSDRRLKKDINTIQGLGLIKKLRGVEFRWKDSNEKSAGLIAQEVEEVAPYLVKTDKNTGLKSVLYANLVAPLIEAVKELYSEISNIKKMIADIIFTQKKHDEELRALKKELEIQRQEIKELKLKLQNDAK